MEREGPLQEESRTTLNGLPFANFTGGVNGEVFEVDDTANSAANTPTETGNLSVTDPDNEEEEGQLNAPTYAIITGTGGNAATVSAGTGTAPDLTYTITKGTGESAVTWGTIALNTATGAWTFTANAAALNSLHADESEILSLQAQVTDDADVAVTKALTITLNGANDDPVIDTGEAAGAPASATIHGVEFAFDADGTTGNGWKVAITQTGGQVALPLILSMVLSRVRQQSSSGLNPIKAMSPRRISSICGMIRQRMSPPMEHPDQRPDQPDPRHRADRYHQ